MPVIRFVWPAGAKCIAIMSKRGEHFVKVFLKMNFLEGLSYSLVDLAYEMLQLSYAGAFVGTFKFKRIMHAHTRMLYAYALSLIHI